MCKEFFLFCIVFVQVELSTSLCLRRVRFVSAQLATANFQKITLSGIFSYKGTF